MSIELDSHTTTLQNDIDAAQAEVEIQRLKNAALRQQLDESRRKEKALRERNRELQADLKQRDQRITDLSAYSDIVACDLESPVALIRGYSDLLVADLDGVLMGDPMDWLKSVQQAGRKLHRIIDDLITISDLQPQGIQPYPVDVGMVLQNVHQRMRSLLHQTQAELQLEGTDWPPVIAFGSWLELIFVKLFSYTLDRMESPTPIHFSAHIEGKMLCFRLGDHGNSIPETLLPILFEPIAPANPHHSAPHHNDLSIVRGMIAHLGGGIHAENNPPQMGGITFYFTLPLAKS